MNIFLLLSTILIFQSGLALQCDKIIPTLESVVEEVTGAYSVQIQLDPKNSTASIIGPYFQGQVPLDDILRKFHLNCCQNVENALMDQCPTLGWKYPSQLLTLGKMLESQANHLFANSKKYRIHQDTTGHWFWIMTSKGNTYSVNLLFRKYVETCCQHMELQ